MNRLSKETYEPVKLVFCDADQRGNKRPVKRHVALVEHGEVAKHTVCGRRLHVALPAHETDTVSQIDCAACFNWVITRTV